MNKIIVEEKDSHTTRTYEGKLKLVKKTDNGHLWIGINQINGNYVTIDLGEFEISCIKRVLRSGRGLEVLDLKPKPLKMEEPT